MAKQYLPYTTGDTWGGLNNNLETAGNLSQMIGNMPKYWSHADEVAQMGDMVPIAHAPLPQDVSALQKTGFTVDRAKKIPQLDDIARGTRMNQGVFVGVGDDATDVAKMYGKGSALRGTKLGATLVEPFVGQAPKDAIQFSRNMYGHLQGKVPSGWANKAFNLPGGGIMDAIQKSKLTRFLARFLPGANIGLGGASVASRLAKGQPVRAGMAAASMVPGPIGWAGLGAETAADYVVSAAKKRKAAEAAAAAKAAAAKAAAIAGGAAGASTSSGGGWQPDYSGAVASQQSQAAEAGQTHEQFMSDLDAVMAKGGLVSVNHLTRRL